MSGKNWTPGPWELFPLPEDRRIEIMDGTGYLIGAAFDNNGNLKNQANARLIAAAPDLYEALESVLDSLGALTKRHELLNHMSDEEADKVFAALAKAKGEA